MKNIPYKFGHYCQDNGVGDFDFVCPETGVRPGFIPFFLAFQLTGTCKCGKEVVREFDE